MASILDRSQIETAVISLAAQRVAITARRLAREAMVSPATLYAVVDGIDAAIDLGQAALAIDAVPRLVAAAQSDKVEPLASWIVQNWGVAGIFFDPSRSGGVSEIPDNLEQHRNAIGAMMAFGSFETELELQAGLRSVLDHTEGCYQHPAATPAGTEISPAVLVGDVWSETRRIITESNDAVQIRLAAIDLFQAAQPDGWTFRGVSELTGLALVSVHRSGSRFEQVNRGIRDFTAGIRSITNAWCDTPRDAVAVSFAITAHAPGVRQALAEIATRNLRIGGIAHGTADASVNLDTTGQDGRLGYSKTKSPKTTAQIQVCIGFLLSEGRPELEFATT